MYVFAIMGLLHGSMLLLNFGLSRLLNLDRRSRAAFTIHTAHKALAVAYIVWSGYLAQSQPAAIIPAIVYHLTQMIMGTVLADHLARRPGTRRQV